MIPIQIDEEQGIIHVIGCLSDDLVFLKYASSGLHNARIKSKGKMWALEACHRMSMTVENAGRKKGEP